MSQRHWDAVQAYLEWEGLTPPLGTPAAIDAYIIFLPYSQHWITGSQVSTCLAVSAVLRC